MFAEEKSVAILAERNRKMTPQQKIAKEEAMKNAYLIEEAPTELAMKVRAQGFKAVGIVAVGGFIGNLGGEMEKGFVAGVAIAAVSIGATVVGHCFEKNEQEPPFPL